MNSPAREPESMVCPNCGGTSYNFGRHFKAPKKTDLKQWAKVRFLFDHGFRFQKIRPIKNSYTTIPYPKTLAEVKKWVKTYKEYGVYKTNGI